jgi:uncharacterized protein YegL
VTHEMLEMVEFAENPEPRCACVLLLDTSSSMDGEKIHALNQGVEAFKDALLEDSLASRRVEVAIISFNSKVELIQDFVTVDKFDPPTLIAQGRTEMGAAILEALRLIKLRKETYKRHGTLYYRPWVLLITDGEPTDSIDQAAKDVHKAEDDKEVVFFAVAVEGADMEKLKKIAPNHRPPKRLKELAFQELFVWLSKSMQVISRSAPDEQITLPPTDGWSVI